MLFSKEKAAEVQRPMDIPTPAKDECIIFAASMVVFDELVARVEMSTRKQAGSELWHLLHNGRITKVWRNSSAS